MQGPGSNTGLHSAGSYFIPTVVSLKRTGGLVVKGCDVYIGRRQTQGGWDLPDSIWGNPFTPKKYGLENAIRLYEEHIRNLLNTDPIYLQCLLNIISSGRSLTLGCWCKKKGHEPCHGDILVKICQEYISYLQSGHR